MNSSIPFVQLVNSASFTIVSNLPLNREFFTPDSSKRKRQLKYSWNRTRFSYDWMSIISILSTPSMTFSEYNEIRKSSPKLFAKSNQKRISILIFLATAPKPDLSYISVNDLAVQYFHIRINPDSIRVSS